jgi:hypothetical protein
VAVASSAEIMSPIARRLASSVARGVSSGALDAELLVSSAKGSNPLLGSTRASDTPAVCAPAIVLSSTSV